MHPKLKKILEIFMDAGVNLTPEEIIELYTLRDACDNKIPNTCLQSPLNCAGVPFLFFGVEFYPLHLLAETWLRQAWELFDGNTIMQVAIHIYAHARSKPGDATLKELNTKEKIENAVLSFFRELPIHETQISFLCQKLREIDGHVKKITHEEKHKESKSEPNPLLFLALLLKEFPGTTLEFWLNGISVKNAIEMMKSLNASTDWATSEERTQAMENFLSYVRALCQKYLGESCNAILRVDN